MLKESSKKSLEMWPEANSRVTSIACRIVSLGQLSHVRSVEVAVHDSNPLNQVEKLGFR
jgi:hypothetical protein